MPDQANKHGVRWQSVVAGGVAGFTPVMVLHPLDVLKTRLQAQDGVRGVLPVYRGVGDALRCILRDEGWRSLYAGLTPALVGAGVSWGVYFAGYNRAKARYQRRAGVQKLPPQMHLLAAAEGGAIACCITNPIWVVKTRLELQRGVRAAAVPASSPAVSASLGSSAASAGRRVVQAALQPYKGTADAVMNIAREEGLAGFYRGLGPSLLLVSHGAIQFMVYEELRSLSANWGRQPASQQQARDHITSESHLPWPWRRTSRGPSSNRSSTDDNCGINSTRATQLRQPSSTEIVGIGALSKLVATIVTYPNQVVRTRLQQRMGRRAIRYRSGWDVLRITLRREGPRGLYKGLLPNVLRVMPQAALTFLVYENLIQYFEAKPAATAQQ